MEGSVVTEEIPHHRPENLFGYTKLQLAKRSKQLKEMERDYILQVLKAKQWRIGGPKGAASALDLNVNTLRGKMEKLDIKKRPFS